ncbi:MAG: SDR family NAD(P)-dependent oxidoreductase [Bacillota bacterium]
MLALITGATGGLGRAMAVECARRGYDLFLTDLSEAPLWELAGGIARRFGSNVRVCACDLTDETQVASLFEEVDGCGEKLGLLLNIAGVDYEGGFLTRESGKIAKIIQLNIEATLRVTHAALNRRAKEFYVVNVSSLASLYPMPLKATYAASKRFLLDFSIALGRELSREGVHVLALCPGGMPTTPENTASLQAQGFWGSVTSHDLGRIAYNTLRHALRGGRVYIPGAVNRALCIAGKLLPREWIAAFIYARWNATQKKWLTTGM